MNLYKIEFSHNAPKSSVTGILTYLLAETDEEVYSYIDKKYNYNSWKDKNEENEIINIYDKEYNIIGTESFKEKMIRINGEMYDEDYDYSDTYYGITLYGWKLIKENVKDEFKEFIKLGIIEEI